MSHLMAKVSVKKESQCYDEVSSASRILKDDEPNLNFERKEDYDGVSADTLPQNEIYCMVISNRINRSRSFL